MASGGETWPTPRGERIWPTAPAGGDRVKKGRALLLVAATTSRTTLYVPVVVPATRPASAAPLVVATATRWTVLAHPVLVPTTRTTASCTPLSSQQQAPRAPRAT